MDPLFSFDLDTAPLDRVPTEFPDALHVALMEDCRTTAEYVVHEAQARLRRQLGPGATGETERGIYAKPAYDGNGWVVLADNARMPNLVLWIEKGTRAGKRHNFARTEARPYFYASLEMAVGPHERKVLGTLARVASEKGLGE
jgi:hypothetical protein